MKKDDAQTSSDENAVKEARAITLPATGPFVDRLIRIFTERPEDDTSAVVLTEYAQAAIATALAARDAELAELREADGNFWEAVARAERAEEQLAAYRQSSVHPEDYEKVIDDFQRIAEENERLIERAGRVKP